MKLKYCRFTDQCRVDKASATETVDLGLIPGRVKPVKTTKSGIHSFPGRRLARKGTV